MTGQEPVSLGPLLLLLILAIGAGLFFSFRRIQSLRRRMVDLSDEHNRLLHHAQLRLAAQKEHGLAERAEGEARIQHLRQAQLHWREAIQSRDPKDEAAYATLRESLDLVEHDLRELGQDPDEATSITT